MVHMLAYDSVKDQLDELTVNARELIARLSEDKWDIETFYLLNEMRQYMENKPIVNLACYDVSMSNAIDYLQSIRREGYKDTVLMLMADEKTSPMEYIKPDILASVLLLKPYSIEALRDKLRQLFETYFEKNEQNSDETFSIQMKEGNTRIPYRQICYFEAREKKLFARTVSKIEYPFYQTLDELQTMLPKKFVRCHRSFIVNWNLVEKIDFSVGRIVLPDGQSIPFSRTYKSLLRELR